MIWIRAVDPLSLSLSLSHTHTHTHTRSLYLSLSLSGQHHVLYDDGDKHWYNLREERKCKRLRWVGEKPAKASRKRPAVEQDSGDDDVGARQPQADPSATPSVAAEDALSREQTRRYECFKVPSIVT